MNPENLVFRDATAADVPAIVVLVESAYRGDASRAGWTTEADLLDGRRVDAQTVIDTLARPDSSILMATAGASLLACCHIEKQGSDCYFGMFCVVPGQQGSGIGRAVLAQAERIARDRWHCRDVRMTVIDVRTELIDWYLRRGYQRTGVYRSFPYGDQRFGIPRRDDLRFEWLVKSVSVESAA